MMATKDGRPTIKWKPYSKQFIKRLKERSTMTPEQQDILDLLNGAKSALGFLMETSGKNCMALVIRDRLESAIDGVKKLSTLCPAPTEPAWLEGWRGIRAECEEISSYACECPNQIEGIIGYEGCKLSFRCRYPHHPNWQPPTNPATGEPYLTYAAWQADQPKPTEEQLCPTCGQVVHGKRRLTEHETRDVLEICDHLFYIGSENDKKACRFSPSGKCGECSLCDDTGCFPHHRDWAYGDVLVPLDFTVEG
jgi:hypothetical protein